jgi:hypothetical protein
MPVRTAPVLLAALAMLAVAACSAAAPAASSSGGPSFAPVAQAPDPTPIVTPTLVPDPVDPVVDPVVDPAPDPVDTPTATPPDTGDVDGATGALDMTVEAVSADSIQVTLVDPRAKAWRLVVSGTGDLATDRWEILVETGDVEPLITATEFRNDRIVDTMDLTGFGDGTAAAGGCRPLLGVCLDSDGFTLPADGNGTFAARLTLQGPTHPLSVRGGTAGWPSEPFVLGPWTDTEAFPWAS